MTNRLLFALAGLLTAGSISLAGDYYPGYTEHGYTFNVHPDNGVGYWYADGVPYTRTYVQGQGYWRYGCYYPGQSYYQYSRAYVEKPKYVPPTVPEYKKKDWQPALIEWAKDREDYQAYLAAIQLMGAHGQSYGYGGAYGGSSGYGYGSSITQYGVNASTQYGVQYPNISALFENSDTSLIQMLGQLQGDYQAGGIQLHQNLQGLVNAKSGNQARITETLSRMFMATEIIKALNAPGVIETKQYTFTIGGNGQVQRDDSKVPDQTKAQVSAAWQALAQSKCASCHSGAKKSGGFDIAAYPSMPIEKKRAVWERLTTPDEGRRMPRDAKDPLKPGKALTPEEQKLFFLG